MAHPFDGIGEKLRRAKQHIEELEGAIDRFLGETPARTLVDYDSEQAELFRSFHQQRVVPLPISVIAGEVVYQLRSALDHAASVFILRGGGDLTLQTQFPIFSHRPVKPSDIARYEGQIRGIDPTGTVWAIIEKFQPYNAGDRWDRHALSLLKRLNNDDKHRALALNVVVVKPKVHIQLSRPEAAAEEILTAEFDDVGAEMMPGAEFMDGYEIMNVQRQLTTNIAFAELKSPIFNQRVIDTLEFLYLCVIGVMKRLNTEIR